MANLTGRCLCGQLRYSAPGPVLWSTLCHCESCRRATSSPMTGFFGVAAGSVTWTGDRTDYKSSPNATRSFCPACGSPMRFVSTRWLGEEHLFIASLDDPEAVAPQSHCHTQERLSWMADPGALPAFPQSAEPDTEPQT